MTVIKHELKAGKNSLIIWTAIIAFMLALCIFIYPQMGSQMSEISGMFANMGSFSAAFGMDKINFGEFSGFFAVECGNVLGLGGAFFAALLGISALSKEEKEHTAEFLLTHPISRTSVVFNKLCAAVLQLILLNYAVAGVTALSVLIIGEKPDVYKLFLMFLAYFIMQLETCAVCFGASAFISANSAGIGLGAAALFYFLNIVANLTEKAEFLKFLTPFGYTDGADIIANGEIELKFLVFGLIFTVMGIAAAFYKYNKKDIA